MTPYRVRLVGRGRVELAAYGFGDAEHRVEKELTRLWPDARVEIEEVRREGESRIAEDFSVGYRLHVHLVVEAADGKDARRLCLRRARERMEETRYRRIEWLDPEVEASAPPE